MNHLPDPPASETCVLCSGGLDSVVLLAWAAAGAPALPVYVRAGLAWERQEVEALQRILDVPPLAGRVRPLVCLDLDVRDLYPPGHWALRGEPPAYDTPDQDVFLPGRNVLLLSTAAVLATLRGVGTLAIGPLAGNPFPDATPEFFDAMGRALTLGLAYDVRIAARPAPVPAADAARLQEATMCVPGRQAGADAGVHEPAQRDPLRRMQQVPRAPGRVRGGGGGGSHGVRGPKENV